MGAKIGSWGAGQPPVVLQPGIEEIMFDFQDIAQMKEMRIYIVNYGVNFVDKADLEASNDGGDTWVSIDQLGVASALGDIPGVFLDVKSVGNYFTPVLFYDRVRLRLKSTLGTVVGKFITQNDLDV